MVIFTGASVEEAIQNGLKTLDIPRMRAHITVISREKKGFLARSQLRWMSSRLLRRQLLKPIKRL